MWKGVCEGASPRSLAEPRDDMRAFEMAWGTGAHLRHIKGEGIGPRPASLDSCLRRNDG